MAKPKPPRLTKWRNAWYIFFHDWLSGEQKRISCSARRAYTRREREILLKKIQDQNIRDQVSRIDFVGGTDFRRPLIHAMQDYLAFMSAQRETRIANPESQLGVGEYSARAAKQIVGCFQDWMDGQGLSSLTCERLDGNLLTSYFNWLGATPYRHGKSRKPRTGATINSHRNRLGACLRWLDMQRPKLFPDFAIVRPALRLRAVAGKRALAFSPSELKKFFKEAAKPSSPSKIRRIKNGRSEVFSQAASKHPSTPVEDLFLLLACTGMRLGEALSLKWSDLDLKSGRIVINAQKTASWRMIPLIGAPECQVAPSLLRTLKRWQEDRPASIHVLPHYGIEKPAYPKHAWERARKNSSIDLTPQKLRQNFVSYCASMGVPPAVAAMWCGHSAAVAEKHYRLQLMDRKKAKSIQGAMGL